MELKECYVNGVFNAELYFIYKFNATPNVITINNATESYKFLRDITNDKLVVRRGAGHLFYELSATLLRYRKSYNKFDNVITGESTYTIYNFNATGPYKDNVMTEYDYNTKVLNIYYSGVHSQFAADFVNAIIE